MIDLSLPDFLFQWKLYEHVEQRYEFKALHRDFKIFSLG